MGKSESIDDKIKKDAEFRVFMSGLEAEGKKKEDAILAEIDDRVKRHYDRNKWDYARLCGEQKGEYQNYSEWTLERVKNIINSIGNALRGGDFPSDKVPGSKDAKGSTVEEAKKNLGAFTGDYDLIIARVQALVSGVLTQFASSSSASHKTTLKDLPLSGGMHLFFGSSGEIFTSNDFFRNEFIGSFSIVFEVYMSVSEAKAIALSEILKTTSIQISDLNFSIVAVSKMQQEELMNILKDKNKRVDYKSTMTAFDVMMEDVTTKRDNLVKKYDEYKKVTDRVEALWIFLDLREFGDDNEAAENKILLTDLPFNEWELGIARRYIRENLQLVNANK